MVDKKTSFFSFLPFVGTKRRKVSRAVKTAEKEDSLKDIEAVLEYLAEVGDDIKKMRSQLEKLRNLEKERLVAGSGLLQVNLQAQIQLLDPLVGEYDLYEDDCVIQGIRLKRIAREWGRRAKKAGMKDLVKDKSKKMTWLRRLK